MRPRGKTRLGFFPLSHSEARRLKRCLAADKPFAALDPCVGDGAGFACLLDAFPAYRYGIEIDAFRAEQAAIRGIETVHADALEVRCPPDSLSLVYLNPPYDFEVGRTDNQRLELVFLAHTYRWLKRTGVLVFVIPQPRLKSCARMLAEHFTDLSVYRLTDPASVQYKSQSWRRGENDTNICGILRCLTPRDGCKRWRRKAILNRSPTRLSRFM